MKIVTIFLNYQKKIIKRILKLLNIDIEWFIEKTLGIRYTFEEADLIVKYFKSLGTIGTAIDVGVSVGAVSEQFLNMGWKVVGFEPDLDNPNKSTAIKKLKSNKNFKLDSRAVSDVSGEELTFFTSPLSEGIASIHAFHPSHEESHKVSTVTVNDYIKDNNIESINFLKIDTEGNDLNVLRGIDFTINKPDMILCEFDEFKAKTTGSDFNTLVNLLASSGYKVLVCEWYPIIIYGQRHKFNCMYLHPSKLRKENAWGNLIAVSPTLSESFFDFLDNQKISKYFIQ